MAAVAPNGGDGGDDGYDEDKREKRAREAEALKKKRQKNKEAAARWKKKQKDTIAQQAATIERMTLDVARLQGENGALRNQLYQLQQGHAGDFLMQQARDREIQLHERAKMEKSGCSSNSGGHAFNSVAAAAAQQGAHATGGNRAATDAQLLNVPGGQPSAGRFDQVPLYGLFDDPKLVFQLAFSH